MATPVGLRAAVVGVAEESSRFVRSFAKVDLPDPFGPHMITAYPFWLSGVENLDNA